MSKYCGSGPLPKGKKRGTDDDCIKSRQVRQFGVVKVDKKKLDAFNSGPKHRIGTVDQEVLKSRMILDKRDAIKKRISILQEELDNENTIPSRKIKVKQMIEKEKKKGNSLQPQYMAQLEAIKEAKRIEAAKEKEKKKGSKTKKKTKSKTKSKTRARR